MLTTRQKLAIARTASFGLRGARRLTGLGADVEATRMGVRWALDLREGIDLAIYLGQYQSVPVRLLEKLRQSPRSTVVDIGANIGAFTLPLAQAVGEGGNVIAIEATAYAYKKLHRNLSLNPLLAGRVAPAQAVLGDGSDAEFKSVDIYSSWRVDGASNERDHPLHGGTPMSTEGAISTTFDAFVDSSEEIRKKVARLAIIKLDVDGFELPILRGARETIAATSPMLLIEIAPHVHDAREEGLGELIDEIGRQGFQLHDPVTGKAVSHAESEMRKLIPHGASRDLLGMLDV